MVGEYWWMLFAPFATIYFLHRSPVLGTVETIAGLTVGLVSLRAHPGSTARRQFWLMSHCWSCSVFCRLCWMCSGLANRER